MRAQNGQPSAPKYDNVTGPRSVSPVACAGATEASRPTDTVSTTAAAANALDRRMTAPICLDIRHRMATGATTCQDEVHTSSTAV